ncbi:MAG: helix-hairpin-helix domain-containing protein [Dehalococcoidia bacterium]|nr:helix-hairpin-helix domain-containing protein [Dehalococcoidia bacterium]
MNRGNRFFLFATVLLIVAVAAGGVTLATKYGRSHPVEIALPEVNASQQEMEVYVGGDVANPGIYLLKDGDTIQSILSDVGLEADNAPALIGVYISVEGKRQPRQKIDINRAEPWLLLALPGIGEELSQRIVDYRSEHGPFERIEELCHVKDIGEATFEKVKDYITVLD